MLRSVSAGVVCACLAGCASAPHQIVDRSDFLAEATRTYPGENSERIIQAAQVVLKTSDPTDFEFRNTVNGFTGLRRYMVYAVLATAVGREKWDFTVDFPTPGQARASVAISEAGQTTGGYSTTPYENTMASVPLYRLFWRRVDYMLRRRPDWVTCDQAAAELAESGTNTIAALGGLCGPTSDGRNAPAPEPLPPAAPQVVQRVPTPARHN
jgi:hypothetical protein